MSAAARCAASSRWAYVVVGGPESTPNFVGIQDTCDSPLVISSPHVRKADESKHHTHNCLGRIPAHGVDMQSIVGFHIDLALGLKIPEAVVTIRNGPCELRK